MRKQPSKNWLRQARMLASKGAGMWAAAMLVLLSFLMIINNFHIISFHFQRASFGKFCSSFLFLPISLRSHSIYSSASAAPALPQQQNPNSTRLGSHEGLGSSDEDSDLSERYRPRIGPMCDTVGII